MLAWDKIFYDSIKHRKQSYISTWGSRYRSLKHCFNWFISVSSEDKVSTKYEWKKLNKFFLMKVSRKNHYFKLILYIIFQKTNS